jgi:hypothetical protein
MRVDAFFSSLKFLKLGHPYGKTGFCELTWDPIYIFLSIKSSITLQEHGASE